MSFIKDKGFFIPDSITYANKKSNTFLGQLSRLSYFDDKGKLVNEREFPDGEQFNIENKIVSKFILNKTSLHIKNEYSAFQGFVLYDTERNIEYEISASNFQDLCLFGKVDRGEILVECVIGFSNKGYPYLLPIESEKYKKAVKFTKKNNSTFDGELKVGHLYSMKKQKEKLLYLGKFRQDVNINELKSYDASCRLITPISDDQIIFSDHKPMNKDIFAILREEPKYYKDENFEFSSNYNSDIEFKSVSVKSIFEDLGEIEDVIFDKINQYYTKKHSNFGLISANFVSTKDIKEGDSVFYLLDEDETTKEKVYFLHNNYDVNYICSNRYTIDELKEKSRINNTIVLEKNGKTSLLNDRNFEEEVKSEKIKETLLKLSNIDVDREIQKKGKLDDDNYYSFDNRNMLSIKYIFKSLGKKAEAFKMEIKGHSSKKPLIINNIFTTNAEKYTLSFYMVHNFFH